MAQSENQRAMTLGEKRVRASFNPSNNNLVDEIKAKSADLIDLCETMKGATGRETIANGEKRRCLALAQTHYEDAAMWAVKAATA